MRGGERRDHWNVGESALKREDRFDPLADDGEILDHAEAHTIAENGAERAPRRSDIRFFIPRRVEELPGPLRCFIGCATYLSGEPDGVFVLRLDPRKRLVKLFMIRNANAATPEIHATTTIDLKRQKVFSAIETLRLIRKTDVFGIPSTPSRRKREKALQTKLQIPATQIFVAEGTPAPGRP